MLRTVDVGTGLGLKADFGQAIDKAADSYTEKDFGASGSRGAGTNK